MRMNSLRDQRQQELADKWIESGMFGVIFACPRFGKIRCTINILEKRRELKKILIAYPDLKIKDSWKTDFKKRGYNDKNVTYTAYASIKKYVDEKYDLIVLDEIHLMSPAQILKVAELKKANKHILGLTGTLTNGSKKWLLTNLHLPVVATYSMEQGIEEGVVTDYDITIIKVPLDTTTLQMYGNKQKTEKQQFNTYTYLINKLQSEGKDASFIRLNRIRIIQNSRAKRHTTISLLRSLSNMRILVFCGVTSVADSLGVPSYHSKSTEKDIFEKFASGEGNHLAVVKLGASGVTYKPLNYVIINYFDSNAEQFTQKVNRAMSFEYDNPDKKAHIFIVISTEQVELLWLSKALEFFDKSKIKYL